MASTDNKRLEELIRCSAPDELWDVYDKNGQRTGRLHRRGDPLGAGEYHLCVHVWMQAPDGRFLLTRRVPEKPCGGLWETTGGSAIAGEDSLTAALREVREETGLKLDPARGGRFLRFWGEHFLCDVWLFRLEETPERVTLQPGETCAWQLADADAIRRLDARDAFFRFDYLEQFLREISPDSL